MLSYCLKCPKNTESKNPKVARIKNRRIMLLSKCVVSDGTKSKLIKQQKARRLLKSLGIKTSLTRIPLVGPLFFNSIKQVNTRSKMNNIVNKFLLAGDKFMPEMHLRQSIFT